VPLCPPVFCSPRLGVALGWKLRQILQPHGGAPGSSPPVTRVRLCRDGWTGLPNPSSVVFLSVGVPA